MYRRLEGGTNCGCPSLEQWPGCFQTKSLHQWTEPGSSAISTVGFRIPEVTCTACRQRRADPHHTFLQCCSLHSTASRPQHVVFWIPRGTNPAHSLRILLIRAGIETNPGPPVREQCSSICEACHTKIRSKASRFVCSTQGCTKATHLKTACSLFPRAKWATTEWRGKDHQDPAYPNRQQIHQQTPTLPPPTSTTEVCPKCNKRPRSRPMTCNSCQRPFCQSCCDITNRYKREKARPTWICLPCSGHGLPQSTSAHKQQPTRHHA